MRWEMVLPILMAMAVGHLFSPVVRADDTTGKIVKSETDAATGATVTTFNGGHVLTITPGTTVEPEYDEFFGVHFPKDSPNCIGHYDREQNAIVVRIMAHQRQQDRNNALIRAAQIRAQNQNNGRIRTNRNLNYRVN